MTFGKRYNPFRSDVYSFGITILHAALMHVPEELRTGDNLETSTEQVISRLSYSENFKNLLRKMLIVDENQRATIEEIAAQADEALQSEPSPRVDIPEESAESEETKSPVLAQRQKSRAEDKKFLPILLQRCFYFYDVVSEKWMKRVPLRMQINFNGDSACTFLKAGRIFACAGGTKPRKC